MSLPASAPARSPGPLRHGQAVWAMVLVTLMWSIAGVVTRQLSAARSFEVTFWRSFFTLLVLAAVLSAKRGPAPLLRSLRAGGRLLWLSGLCWATMFTTFMVALTLTTVANVLVTMALAPLVSALWARLFTGQRLAPRTWAAIVLAGGGIGWMFGTQLQASAPHHLLGTLIALAVPVAAATNWALIGRAAHRGHAAEPDMLPAVLVGAALSSLVTLPAALPFAATSTDLAWLALLGTVQLALPCLLAVQVARSLSGPEVALLALLEVLFGVAWAWLGAGETPPPTTLAGGGLVLAALAGNEGLALRVKQP